MGKKRSGSEINYKDFGDLFLQGKNDPPRFAALWFSGDGDMGMHFFGYKNATETLLNWFFKGNDDNGTVYPLMFLVRHTVEIGLKESIRRARQLGSNTISMSEEEMKAIRRTHNLRELTRIFNKLMEEYQISEYSELTELVPLLHKWQDADPKAVFGKYAASGP